MVYATPTWSPTFIYLVIGMQRMKFDKNRWASREECLQSYTHFAKEEQSEILYHYGYMLPRIQARQCMHYQYYHCLLLQRHNNIQILNFGQVKNLKHCSNEKILNFDQMKSYERWHPVYFYIIFFYRISNCFYALVSCFAIMRVKFIIYLFV